MEPSFLLELEGGVDTGSAFPETTDDPDPDLGDPVPDPDDPDPEPVPDNPCTDEPEPDLDESVPKSDELEPVPTLVSEGPDLDESEPAPDDPDSVPDPGGTNDPEPDREPTPKLLAILLSFKRPSAPKTTVLDVPAAGIFTFCPAIAISCPGVP